MLVNLSLLRSLLFLSKVLHLLNLGTVHPLTIQIESIDLHLLELCFIKLELSIAFDIFDTLNLLVYTVYYYYESLDPFAFE